MNKEILRRHVEEFFGYQLVACHIPGDSEEIAEAFASDFEIPELEAPFKRFLDQCGEIDTLHGLAFVMDAYGDDSKVKGADIFVHFYQDESIKEEKVTDDASEIRLLPHHLLAEVEDLLYNREDCHFTVPSYYTYVGIKDIRTSLARLVKRTYDGDPGFMGLGRDTGGPPSGFIVAMKDGFIYE